MVYFVEHRKHIFSFRNTSLSMLFPRYLLNRNVVCVKILFEVFDFLLVITVMSI